MGKNTPVKRKLKYGSPPSYSGLSRYAGSFARGAGRLIGRLTSTRPGLRDRLRGSTGIRRGPIAVQDSGDSSGPWAGRTYYRDKGDRRSALYKLVQQVVNSNAGNDQTYSQIGIDTITTNVNCCGWIVNGFELWGITDLANIANSIQTNANLNTAVPSSFYVKDGSVKHTLSNASTGACKLIAYRCLARRDVPATRGAKVGIYTVPAGTNNVNAGSNSIVNILYNGIAAQGGNTTTSNWTGASYPTVTPFMSNVFCEYFKIISTEVVNLEAGGITTFTLRTNKGRKIHSEYIESSTNIINKGSQVYLIKVVGQPANDSTTHGNIGIAPVKIDINTEVRYHYTWSAPNQTKIVLPTNTYGAITTAEIVDAATGATGNVVMA